MERSSTPTARRRDVLAGAAGFGTAASAGCVERVQRALSRPQREVVSLSIKCLPADTDPVATTIARRLATALETVGADVDVQLMAEAELRRRVLLANDFDIYVARFPPHHDPDYLRGLLHSVYINQPGWLNPFGFTDLQVDELLDEQRRQRGRTREQTIEAGLRAIVRQQPFATVAIPDEISAVRTGRYEGWSAFGPHDPLRYLQLSRSSPAPTDEPTQLQVSTTDAGVTRRFNPLAVEFGDRRLVTGLMYDPLGRRINGTLQPWVATGWTWSEETESTVAEVTIREGVNFHDGNPLTTEDVAFSYRFLGDTSLGRNEASIPAPRFLGHISSIDSLTVTNGRRLRIDFGSTSKPVAKRALTVPILPKHIWSEKTGPAQIAGFEVLDDLTEALVWSNPQPIGSGPLRFEARESGNSLTLARFDDHFVTELADFPVAFDQLRMRVTPSDAAAVELAAAGDVDGTATGLSPDVVPRIGRSADLDLVIHRPQSFYHVGYNVRRPPLANPHFRRVVSRLLDKAAIVRDIFDGYAAPAAAPLAQTSWLPADLRWTGEDPEVPFFGDDGQLDVDTAKAALRAAGYEYDPRGRLLVN